MPWNAFCFWLLLDVARFANQLEDALDLPIRKRHCEVNLPGDFLEAGARVEALTDVVLIESFDLGDHHALFFEVVEGRLHEGLTYPFPLMARKD